MALRGSEISVSSSSTLNSFPILAKMKKLPSELQAASLQPKILGDQEIELIEAFEQ